MEPAEVLPYLAMFDTTCVCRGTRQHHVSLQLGGKNLQLVWLL